MIYFLRAGDAVKIGWTKDGTTFQSRILKLQTGNPTKIEVARTIEAARWAEVWLHGFYAAYRLVGEWFKFQPHMMEVQIPSERPTLQSPQIYDYDLSQGECPHCDRRRAADAERQRKHREKHAATAPGNRRCK